MSSALAMFSTGVVLLAVDGNILCMNQMASAVLARNDSLIATRSGGLKAKALGESSQLERFVREAIATSLGTGWGAGGQLLVSRGGRPPLLVLVTPVQVHPVDVARTAGAIVFITAPKAIHARRVTCSERDLV